jgi:hypothetical protein
MTRCRVAALAFCLLLPALALAQSATRGLHADRFEFEATLLPDGSIDVVETITFRFTGRTFREVERVVPSGRTDGIIDVRARREENGTAVDDDVRVDIRQRRRNLRVRWRFPSTTDVVHKFTLEYRAMGVMRVDGDRARLNWHVLPTRHRYRISEAVVRWRIPDRAVSLLGPALEAEGWSWAQEDGAWVARKRDLAVNETAILTDTIDATTMAMATPVWQMQDDRAQQLAPAFIVGAVIILVMGAGTIVMMVARYHRPKVDRRQAVPAEAGSLPPALGVAIRGPQPRLGLAEMGATLFDLVGRGMLRIEPSTGATARQGRDFDLVAVASPGSAVPLRPHERVVLDALWLHMKQGRIGLTDARRHVHSGHRAFKSAGIEELRQAGLLDAERRWASAGLNLAGLVSVLVGVAGLVLAVVLLAGLGDAVLLIPGAIILVGIALLIAGQSFPTLSQSGAELGARWAARARDLRARARGGLSEQDIATWMPVAIALGIGGTIAKGGGTVEWLRGVDDPSGALIAVIAAGSASSHGGAGAGAAGGVAGGGGFSGAR